MSSMNEKQCAGCGECKCGETVAKAIEARPSGWSQLLFRATVADLLHVLTPYLQIRLPMPEADHDIACRAIDKLSFMLESDVTPPADADRAEALRLADRIDPSGAGSMAIEAADVAAAAALLRRLAAAPAVPEGWKLVPINATPEMLSRGRWSGSGDVSVSEEWARREVWDRMLAAAPAPEGGAA